MESGPITATLDAIALPMTTTAPDWKLVPAIATGVPPEAGPEPGIIDPTTGAMQTSPGDDPGIVMAPSTVQPDASVTRTPYVVVCEGVTTIDGVVWPSGSHW